jgi:DNA polymerase III subunit epsilon
MQIVRQEQRTMREIVLNRRPTGDTFHRYLCPERSMPADALAIHGLSAEFLADKPLFAAVADEFLAFVGDAPLVAHNAGFDIAFLSAELKRAAKPPIATERVVDTLVLARRPHAGGLTLDDLCSRYGVDRSRRTVPIWSRQVGVGAKTRRSDRPGPPAQIL